jgi:hypothetical protein
MITASKLGPHTQTVFMLQCAYAPCSYREGIAHSNMNKRTERRAPVKGSEFPSKAAKKHDLIQTLVAQRPMLRVEVFARALRASLNVK